MWSYYGRKTKVIQYYPDPIYDTIIEPFAGTAVYSLYKNNWEKDVILIDNYIIIIKIWKYLQQAKPDDIMKLPDISYKDPIPDYLCEEEKWLIGFAINNGSAVPKHTAQKLNDWNDIDRYKVKGRSTKRDIANNLYKIKHWKLILGEYNCIDNIKATYFIDPPYQDGGKYYRRRNIDYVQLAEWCKTRNGQVMVCENSKATWLPTTPIKETYGQLHKSTETLWYKE